MWKTFEKFSCTNKTFVVPLRKQNKYITNMAKLFELSEENIDLIEEVFQNTGLHNYMELKTMGVTKSKQLIKIQKNNPVTEYLAKAPDSINIQVYEDAFDRLDIETKKILLEDAFSIVGYDSDKDKILIGAPQITVTIGGRQRFGDALINAAEAGVLAIQQIEDEKKALKEEG